MQKDKFLNEKLQPGGGISIDIDHPGEGGLCTQGILLSHFPLPWNTMSATFADTPAPGCE